MIDGVERWVGAYYPLEKIQNPHSRVLICLLFDKIVCHFPVSDMAHGGGHGMSQDLFDGDLLVEEGVIEPREESLLGDIELKSSAGEFWGTDEEYEQYVRMQVTGMAIKGYRDKGIVPVSDDQAWPVPASLLQNLDLSRCASLQASALALESIRIAVPAFAAMSDHDLLEAREKLRDHLIPFRCAMLSLAPSVRSGIESGATVSDVQREAKYIVDTKVAPALAELRERLSKERGRFWRRLITRGGAAVPQVILNWTTGNAIAAALSAIETTRDITLDAIDWSSIRNHGGLGYLLAAPRHFPSASNDGSHAASPR
jgi:hypothetical protein